MKTKMAKMNFGAAVLCFDNHISKKILQITDFGIAALHTILIDVVDAEINFKEFN